MTVFVDQSIFPFRGTLYCHVWADTIEELHAAAHSVGLRREWFQEPPKASWQHYDCAPRIRAMLVERGAVETDKYGPLIWQGGQAVLHSNNPKSIERGWSKILMVVRLRSDDLFAPIAPEIDIVACRARWHWYQARKADFLQWWIDAGRPV